MANGDSIKDVYAAIERKHTDYKAMFAAITTRLEVLERHSAEQDYQNRDVDKRLEGGAKRFAAIEAITKPPLWRIFSLFGTLIALVAALVWVAATYPDGEKVKEMIEERSPYQLDKDRILRAVNSYETTVPSILLQLGVIDVKLDNISKKLEEVPTRPVRRPR